jgi:hypothetical protein
MSKENGEDKNKSSSENKFTGTTGHEFFLKTR